MKAWAASTPIRASLQGSSALQHGVRDGIGAVKKNDRKHLSVEIRTAFGDSLDLDAAMEGGHEQENRWDYLLGHSSTRELVAVEPHSAKRGEISTVISKRRAAKDQLAGHLKPSARIAKWLWVASGKVHFADTGKAVKQLADHGIEFVGGPLRERHLPAPKQSRAPRGRQAESRNG